MAHACGGEHYIMVETEYGSNFLKGTVWNKDNDVKVSVYCLCYNHSEYLKDALDGFLNQETNFKYEVIIHDDASTDDSQDIIKEYEEKYPNIIRPIYQKENQLQRGVNIRKKYILPMIRGKYIASCEGDDYWCDTYKLQKQVNFMERHPEYSASVHNTYLHNCKTKKNKVMYSVDQEKDIKIVDVIQNGSSAFHTSSILYRAEFADPDIWPDFMFKAVGFTDYPLGIYLTLMGKVRYFPDLMSVYRWQTKGSWTKMHSNRKKAAETCAKMIETLLSVDEYSKNHYSKEIQEVILNKEYLLLDMEGKYEEMMSEKYKLIRKGRSYGHRTRLFCVTRSKLLRHLYDNYKDRTGV